ncbi:MAG TPA: efflux RND transporter permease subunit [Chloroflexota bacterium]
MSQPSIPRDPEPVTPGPQRMWLSDLSIRQPVFITMLVAAVLVAGGLFYTRMALDLLPDVSLPIVVVQTAYPGADPQEVERSISKPIEDAVASINGVNNVRSSSMDSVSAVVVEFQMESDPKTAADDVRNRVNAMKSTLPPGAREPVINKVDFSDAPMMTVVVADSGGNRTPEQLRSLVDDTIKPRLERVDGVAAATITGGRVRQIQVALDLDRLRAYGVPPQQVIQAVGSENMDVPGGRVAGGSAEELVRTAGRVSSLGQLENIPVVTPRGTTVKLKDVASVADGYEEVRTLARLNGSDSVVAEVRKQSGTNMVQVSDAVKRELDSLRKQYPDLSIGIASDQSTFTRQSVQDVQISLFIGGILAALVVLLFFRDLRNTLVTVAGLPVVIFGTFGVLHLLGITLNTVSLMALSISIGMLIDDAIVVRENIFRHMEHGEEPRVAASRGTGEIAMAVIAVSSTIVTVFLPIAFTGGISGKFLREFGITVAVAVVISLIEAFTFAPMLSAYFFRRRPGMGAADAEGAPRLGPLVREYRALLGWALRHRATVIASAVVIFVASLGIIPFMSLSFLPVVDQGEFSAAIEMKPGARLQDTDQAARTVERILMADPGVQQVFTSIGAADGPADKASFKIKLKTLGTTDATIERVRPRLLEALPYITVRVDKPSTTAMFQAGGSISSLRGRPIQFSVEGSDMNQLDQVSAELERRLQAVPGVTDVDRSLKEGGPQRQIALDREKATDLGVSTAVLGSTVRTLINGTVAGSYRAADKDVDILVRLQESDRNDPNRIIDLPVVSTRGVQMPLSSVARVSSTTEPNVIDRQNRQRQVLVGAGYGGRDMGAVLARARAAAASVPLPEGTTVRLSGDSKYMDEMFDSLKLAIGLSVLFVYMILASQFGSFVHPFTIMLALPFSIAGALLSLLVARFSLDMLAMIGIILLMGLVTKNSILLVEFTNQMKRRGLSTREAILEAGPIRLRPILMTTFAMIFGMAPVAAGFGAGAELRQPMGISVIGGLITSTLLTLVVVPVGYSLVDDMSRRVAGRFRGGKPRMEPEIIARPEEPVELTPSTWR